MRKRGDQIGALALLVADIGDILQDGDSSERGFVGSRPRQLAAHVKVIAAAHEYAKLGRRAKVRIARLRARRDQPLDMTIVCCKAPQIAADHAAHVEFQYRAGNLVDMYDGAHQIEHDKTVINTFEDS